MGEAVLTQIKNITGVRVEECADGIINVFTDGMYAFTTAKKVFTENGFTVYGYKKSYFAGFSVCDENYCTVARLHCD